jgi:hypothetical protein
VAWYLIKYRNNFTFSLLTVEIKKGSRTVCRYCVFSVHPTWFIFCYYNFKVLVVFMFDKYKHSGLHWYEVPRDFLEARDYCDSLHVIFCTLHDEVNCYKSSTVCGSFTAVYGLFPRMIWHLKLGNFSNLRVSCSCAWEIGGGGWRSVIADIRGCIQKFPDCVVTK